MVYPTLVFIKVAYDQIHPFYVNKLNKMLDKGFNPCKVVVKIDDNLEDCYFKVEHSFK